MKVLVATKAPQVFEKLSAVPDVEPIVAIDTGRIYEALPSTQLAIVDYPDLVAQPFSVELIRKLLAEARFQQCSSDEFLSSPETFLSSRVPARRAYKLPGKRTIAFTSYSGGTGKTSFALATALHFVNQTQRRLQLPAAVFEFTYGESALGTLVGEARPALSELISQPEIEPYRFNGVSLYPMDYDNVKLLPREQVERYFREQVAQHVLTVIDTIWPHGLALALGNTVDLWVVLTTPRIDAVENAQKLRQELAATYGAERVIVALNQKAGLAAALAMMGSQREIEVTRLSQNEVFFDERLGQAVLKRVYQAEWKEFEKLHARPLGRGRRPKPPKQAKVKVVRPEKKVPLRVASNPQVLVATRNEGVYEVLRGCEDIVYHVALDTGTISKLLPQAHLVIIDYNDLVQYPFSEGEIREQIFTSQAYECESKDFILTPHKFLDQIREPHPGRMLSFPEHYCLAYVSYSGGTGRTTLALDTAFYYAKVIKEYQQKHKREALAGALAVTKPSMVVELTYGASSLVALTGLEMPKMYQLVTQPEAKPLEYKGVSLVPMDYDNARLLAINLLERYLKKQVAAHGLTVVDCIWPHGLAPALADCVDLWVVVAAGRPDAALNARKLYGELVEQFSKEKVWLLLNQAQEALPHKEFGTMTWDIELPRIERPDEYRGELGRAVLAQVFSPIWQEFDKGRKPGAPR
jgi:hypothetical protein